MTPLAAPAPQITEWLRALVAPGSVVELRTTKSNLSGWYHRLEDLARDAYALSEAGENVYWTINPVQDDMLQRSDHKYGPASRGQATSDKDVVRRARLLIDVDPKRPAGMCATDTEKAGAWDLTNLVSDHLKAIGWPAPAIVDSGNGYHLYYQIDLPTDDGGLVKRVLYALAEQFSNDMASVDTSVSNASRIAKVPGTVGHKGDDTEERPHRTAFLISAPDKWVTVPREQLEAMAGPAVVPAQHRANMTGLWDQPPERPQVSREERVNRAREYLKKVPIAVDGSGGSTATITAMAKIRIGFDLTHEETFEAAQDWNAACDGPWEPADLMRKITEGKGENDGHLLERVQDDAGSSLWKGQASGQASTLATATAGIVVPTRPKFKIPFMTHEEFDAADFTVDYLIDGILVDRQPGVVGGFSKNLKTGVAGCDMAFSLGTGTRFLGRFDVPQAVPVGIISGESGNATLRQTMRQVARARNRSFTPASIFWGLSLPRLSNREHLEALEEWIVTNSLRVAILDPAYLCLLAGSTINAANVFEMGQVLFTLTELGQRTGCTIILIHHFKKPTRETRFAVPSLEDMSMSGFAEWARQWILLGRRSAYQSNGIHDLWMVAGGSAGHSGQWGITIDEGTNVTGRKWDVQFVEAEPGAKGQRSGSTAKDKVLEGDRQKVLKALSEGHETGMTFTSIRLFSNVNTAPLHKILQSLIAEGLVTPTNDVRTAKSKRVFDGYRLEFIGKVSSGMTGIDTGISGFIPVTAG